MLDEIRQALEERTKLQEALVMQNADTAELQQKIKALSASLNDLSTKYYELVPVQRNQIRAMSSVAQVDEALEHLRHLAQQNAAGRLLIAAESRKEHINPYQYMLQGLGCGLAAVPAESDVYGVLSAYFALKRPTAAANQHFFYNQGVVTDEEIVHIFALERQGEAERFRPYADKHNRVLLWHGSTASNIIGILRDGLCSAPACAPITGHAFGKGVYFADMAEKSLGYAANSGGNPNTNQHRFLFLSEVYLGLMDQGHDKPRAGYDSLLVKGQVGPTGSLITSSTGVRVPAAPVVQGNHLMRIWGRLLAWA